MNEAKNPDFRQDLFSVSTGPSRRETGGTQLDTEVRTIRLPDYRQSPVAVADREARPEPNAAGENRRFVPDETPSGGDSGNGVAAPKTGKA